MKDLILEILEESGRLTARKLVEELKACSHNLTMGEVSAVLGELQTDGLVKKIGAGWRLTKEKTEVIIKEEPAVQDASEAEPEIKEAIVEVEPDPVFYADPAIIDLLLKDIAGNNSLLQKSKLAPLFMGFLKLVAEEKGEDVLSLLNNVCWYATPLVLSPLDFRGITSLTNSEGEIIYPLRPEYIDSPEAYFHNLCGIKPHADQAMLDKLLQSEWLKAVVERINSNEFTSLSLSQLTDYAYYLYGFKEEFEEIEEPALEELTEEEDFYTDLHASSLLLKLIHENKEYAFKNKLAPLFIEILQLIARAKGEMLLTYAKHLPNYAVALILDLTDFIEIESLADVDGKVLYDIRKDYLDNESIYFLSLQSVSPSCEKADLDKLLQSEWCSYVVQEISRAEGLEISFSDLKENCYKIFGIQVVDVVKDVPKLTADVDAFCSLLSSDRKLLHEANLAPIFMNILKAIAIEKEASLLSFKKYIEFYAPALIMTKKDIDEIDLMEMSSTGVLFEARPEFRDNETVYFLTLQTISPHCSEEEFKSFFDSPWFEYVFKQLNEKEGTDVSLVKFKKRCLQIYGYDDSRFAELSKEVDAKTAEALKKAKEQVKVAKSVKIPKTAISEDIIQSVLKGPKQKPKIEIPKSTDPEAKVRVEHIRKGAKKVSFDNLLGPWLKGSKTIVLTDPYIRQWHQFRNLRELLSMIRFKIAKSEEVDFKLITQCEFEEYSVVDDELNSIKMQYARTLVNFDYELTDGLHDRTIVTDTNWLILLGRGISIYDRSNDDNPEKRPCLEFFVTYSRKG